jgi:hypothetical protein
MNIVETLIAKYPNAEWVLIGEDYAGLNWLDNTPKPTEKQLQDLWLIVQAEAVTKEQARIDAKASAISKLQALGLTVQEVEVAFGLTE